MRLGIKQSMLEKLIAGHSNATDQQQTTTLVTSLFNSGVLKSGWVMSFHIY
jgi:glucuronate isomerase